MPILYKILYKIIIYYFKNILLNNISFILYLYIILLKGIYYK